MGLSLSEHKQAVTAIIQRHKSELGAGQTGAGDAVQEDAPGAAASAAFVPALAAAVELPDVPIGDAFRECMRAASIVRQGPCSCTIGDFTIGDRLGARRSASAVRSNKYYGTNAAVFAAAHRDGARVALKVLYSLSDAPGGESVIDVDRLPEFSLFTNEGRVHSVQGGAGCRCTDTAIDTSGRSFCPWSLHLMRVFSVFSTKLTKRLRGAMDIDAEFAASSTTVAVLPRMADQMQSVLSQRRKEGQRPLFGAREILVVTLQMAKGLAHAHACRIVHRDVKPDNVVVRRGFDPMDMRPVDDCEDALAVVADFGEALDLNTVGRSDFLVPSMVSRAGPAWFFAPEVRRMRYGASTALSCALA